LPPLEIDNPFSRAQVPVLEADAFELPPELAQASAEKPLGKDDDCVPVKLPEPAPKPARPSVFSGARPEQKSFSEQVGAARKRLSPPAVVRPRPEC
jgi:hypothetical protein